MLAKVFSAGLQGIDAYPIAIKVDVNRRMPTEMVVGLPGTAVKESKGRISTELNGTTLSGYSPFRGSLLSPVRQAPL